LGLFTVKDVDEGLKVCRVLLEIDGMGHTAVIHTRHTCLSQRFATEMPVSRVRSTLPRRTGCWGSQPVLRRP
jgi:acetaldehyde dehydrogenase/alcohol dehydrogenase